MLPPAVTGPDLPHWEPPSQDLKSQQRVPVTDLQGLAGTEQQSELEKFTARAGAFK